MKKLKKIFHVLSSIFLYSLLVLLIIVAVLFAAYGIDQYVGSKKGEHRAPLFGAYVIISPSMVPTINVYDAVVTMRVSPDRIKLYDIITFISSDINTNGTPITHRVVGIVDTEDGEKVFRTKGDNNASEDRALIKKNEILGKVILRIPMIGYVKTFLSSKLGWLVAIIIPCVLIIGHDILKLMGLLKEKDDEEEDSKKTEVSEEEQRRQLMERIKAKEEEIASGRINFNDTYSQNTQQSIENNNINNINNNIDKEGE